MQFYNSSSRYGAVAMTFHWVTAVVVVGLFSVGLWMEDMDYGNPWYKTAPHWHKSVGVLLVTFMLARLLWRLKSPPPPPLNTHTSWEKRAAKIAHALLYVLIFLMLPTGYLITTAQGQGLDVFNWFTIPAVITSVSNLEDYAGEVHEIIAFSIIGIAIIHMLGALKHHFIDKDRTLKRMLGVSSGNDT